MPKTNRPAQNPVTFTGTAAGDPKTVVRVSLCRMDTEGSPRDGLNRVGRANQAEKSVVLTTFTGDDKAPKVGQTVIIPERHLIEGFLLLFPDVMVDQSAVGIAKLRDFLFNETKPGLGSE